MISLATKYRPTKFENVLGQKYIVEILKRQAETKEIANCYLFSGPTGTGKTTLARIFANAINDGQGNPFEIDAASNNGVDNIRAIIEESQLSSIDSVYRVYIIDEAHMISIQGWNAFLKTLEEPNPKTVFILCTTEPQKIPNTILNRVMPFNLTKVPSEAISERLKLICQNEGFTNYDDACEYISKLCLGGVRDAISLLDKCRQYSTDLTLDNVQKITGNVSFVDFIKLTNNLVDCNYSNAVSWLDKVYSQGYDLKDVVDQYLDFILDLLKYISYGSMKTTKIPAYLETVNTPDGKISPECIKYVIGFKDSSKYFLNLVDKLLDLKNRLRYDTNVKLTVSAFLVSVCNK